MPTSSGNAPLWMGAPAAEPPPEAVARAGAVGPRIAGAPERMTPKPGPVHAIGLALWLLLVGARSLSAQATPGTTPADTISVAAGGRLEIRLDRMPGPSEGALAIFVGEADLTGLFVRTENS